MFSEDTIHVFVSIEREWLANIRGIFSSEFQEVIRQGDCRLCKMLITACQSWCVYIDFSSGKSHTYCVKWGSFESSFLQFEQITITLKKKIQRLIPPTFWRCHSFLQFLLWTGNFKTKMQEIFNLNHS